MKKTLYLLVMILIGFALVSCKGNPPPAPPDSTLPSVASAAASIGSAPVLGVSLSSRYFSPDGDGVDDILTISLSCRSEVTVSNWSFEIIEPEAPFVSFFQWNGNGNPPTTLTWDGKNRTGEVVQSASQYPFTFTVTNAQGTKGEYKGFIQVDILVIKDGDLLRVQVPSIYFPPNIGNFNGLDPNLAVDNQYILGRIAATLNIFRDYKVRIEGHANITTSTPEARRREQDLELQPLSEIRAKTVTDYLVNLGVDRNRLSFFGIGGGRPVVPYENHAGWWKNRRVEFILVK